MHNIALISSVFKTFFWDKLIPVGEQVAENGDDWHGYLGGGVVYWWACRIVWENILTYNIF